MLVDTQAPVADNQNTKASARLHLGCAGDIRDGFLNIDMIPREAPNYLCWNLSSGLLPPQIEAVEFVYSSHFIEHLTNPQVEMLLNSCYEKMVTGGIFRAALPNFRLMFKAYLENDWSVFDKLPLDVLAPNNLLIEVVEYGVYQFGEHVSLWDEPKAEFYLKRAGFKHISFTDFKAEFDVPTEERRRGSFYVEAVK